MTLRRLSLFVSMAIAAVALSQGAFAEQTGMAQPWQMGLQPAATPVARDIHSLHTFILWIITAISAFVLALLLIVAVKFNSKANPVPSKTTHNTFIEVVWTVVPVLILVAIAIPSFRLLYFQRDIPTADLTIKAIGNPGWNWSYQYPDFGVDETTKDALITFDANLLPEEDAKAQNRPYRLATDTPIFVPVNKTVKMIITSDPAGMIHSWTIPAFGMKIDAIPGRLNQDWFKAEKEGIYYGQCSELCGINHAFMPIEIHVLSQANYDAWGAKVQTAGVDAARDMMFARLASTNQQAQK
jgi:cytochrome c oxidase subunit II